MLNMRVLVLGVFLLFSLATAEDETSGEKPSWAKDEFQVSVKILLLNSTPYPLYDARILTDASPHEIHQRGKIPVGADVVYVVHAAGRHKDLKGIATWALPTLLPYRRIVVTWEAIYSLHSDDNFVGVALTHAGGLLPPSGGEWWKWWNDIKDRTSPWHSAFASSRWSRNSIDFMSSSFRFEANIEKGNHPTLRLTVGSYQPH